MPVKIIKLKFRVVNRDIFEAIRDGKKPVETRAATVKYAGIKAGDMVEFICGKDKFTKPVKCAGIFKSITDLVKKYKPEEINPNIKTIDELEKMYYSFPGYKEKIEESGIIAIEL
jgi:ASC-1-like (ASCH) protein